MMRIGLLTTSFPRYDGDVAGCFVLGFARALVERGHSIEVLAPEPRESRPLPSWPGVVLRWIPYMRPRTLQRTFYGAGVPDNLRRNPAAWVGLGPFCTALARETRARVAGWDALVSHWGVPCALVAGASRTTRSHIAVMHSTDVHLLRSIPFGGLLAQRIARSANDLVFVTAQLREGFLNLLRTSAQGDALRRSHVFPMGVELPEIPTHRSALRDSLGFHRITAVTVSRLVPIKGLDVAIRAVAAQRAVELVVVGDGPERRRLEQLASALGAPVRFMGVVTGTDKERLLDAADLFILPSIELDSGRAEGAPHGLLEALAAGLPVVASRTGGVEELVRDGVQGLLVPHSSPELLGHAVARLASDETLRTQMRAAARRAAAPHAWPRVSARIETLLRAAPETVRA